MSNPMREESLSSVYDSMTSIVSNSTVPFFQVLRVCVRVSSSQTERKGRRGKQECFLQRGSQFEMRPRTSKEDDSRIDDGGDISE